MRPLSAITEVLTTLPSLLFGPERDMWAAVTPARVVWYTAKVMCVARGHCDVSFGSLTSRVLIVIMSMLGVVVVGFAEHWTQYGISLSVFYLVPVLAAAWYAGWWPSFWISLFSGVTWYWVDVNSGRSFEYAAIPVWNAFVRLGFFLINGYLATQLHVYLERERRLARQDTLTGLLNGRAFVEEGERFLALARRKRQTFTLVYIDLDNFKLVNDTQGHSEGNKVLCIVAETLLRNTRHYDILARLGGDEFGIMLPDTDHAEAEGYICKVCEVLEKEVSSRRWPVSFSIGVATFREVPDSVDQALNVADALMYRVKRAGKQGVLQGIWPLDMCAAPAFQVQEDVERVRVPEFP